MSTWIEKTIAHHRATIEELRAGIADMETGGFRIYKGKSQNALSDVTDEMIASDKKSVEMLQAIVDRYEAGEVEERST